MKTEIRYISQQNLEDYKKYLSMDNMENMRRQSYHGMVLHTEAEEPVQAILIWNDWNYLKTETGEVERNAEIIEFQADQPENGKQLLEAFLQEAEKVGIVRTQFRLPLDWEDARVPMLKASGFQLEEQENNQMVITVEELTALPIAKKELLIQDVISMGEVNMQQFRKAMMTCTQSSITEMPRDLMALPLSWFEPDISSCIKTEGKVRGLFLIHRTGSGVLETQLLCGFDQTNNMGILHMIVHSIQKIQKKYPPDTFIRIRWNRQQTKHLAQKMLNRKMGDMVIVAER
ncbi:MAG: hypothetical protein IJ040_07745 [Lachnospiraceae bacterium]|nr:hypothetical protein [Lachnospiraceae bacterium]